MNFKKTWVRRWTKEREATTQIVVHARRSPTSAPEMDTWFRKKGYLQCGFHFTVSQSEIVHTRDYTTVGAHLPDLDQTSVAVCILGWDGKDPDALSDTIRSNLKELIDLLLREYPHAEIKAAPAFIDSVGGYDPLFQLIEELSSDRRT